MNLAAKSLAIALTQEGVSEKPKGSNGGPEVTQYLKAVGLGAGYPWCMAFVYWCVKKAALELEEKNPLVRTAGVMRQYRECTLRKLPNRNLNVQPGDIFIMQFANGLGHTGFVIELKGRVVKTIEGNTNDDGSREGYEVAIRERPVSSIHGFIQLNT